MWKPIKKIVNDDIQIFLPKIIQIFIDTWVEC